MMSRIQAVAGTGLAASLAMLAPTHASAAASCPRGTALGDGCPSPAIAAGANTVQHADFFSGYAAQKSHLQSAAGIARKTYATGWRPAWNMPGIDYPVGVPATITLLDPVANSSKLPPGCQLNSVAGYRGSGKSYSVNCNGYFAGSANNGKSGTQGQAMYTYTKLNISGWDFRNNSVSLSVQNWRGEISFTHNRVGGNSVNASKAQNAWISLSLSQNISSDPCMQSPLNGCVQIKENSLDGNVTGFDPSSGNWWGTDLIQIDQGFSATYNVMTNANARFIIQGTRHRPSLQDYCTFNNNYVEGFLNPDNGPELGAHGEVTLTGGPCGHSFYQYNTMLQPTKNGYNTTSKPGSINDGDVSGFVFPFTGVSPANCTNVTFSGYVGTVRGSCDPEGAFVRTGLNDDTTLNITSSSAGAIKGHVVAFNGLDKYHYNGDRIKSITMSEINSIPNGVSLSVAQIVPEMHIDHNVMVTNYWNSGATEWGVMVGGMSVHKFKVFHIEKNWFDSTGSYGCFQVTQGVSVGEAATKSAQVVASGNVDLNNMNSYISSFSDAQNPNCRGYKAGYNSRYGEP